MKWSSTSESEMERRTKLRPGLWKKGSGRLDETNRFRTNDTNVCFFYFFVGSGRLDNGNRNEPVSFATLCSGRLDNGNRNEPVLDIWMMSSKRTGMPDEITTRTLVKDPWLRLQDEISKGAVSTFRRLKEKGKGEDERGKRKGKRKGKPKWSGETFRRYTSKCSMAPWTYRNSIFRRYIIL
uniref:Uncharacterized protein n=1 Tax=Rhizophagus irregularis (strain DAOM 181602 / DAOM 197198 / MUCL 43194) TaxID=747089 RepID=U9T4W0_RHIID